MKNRTLYFLFLMAGITYLFLLSNTAGGPVQSSGAPGEATCGRSGCHAVLENQGAATIELNFNEGSLFYAKDEVYPMEVSLSNLQNDNKNGFQIVALDSLSNNIGSWLLTDEAATQLRAGTSLADRSYLTHTTEGVTQTSWNFNWQAPSDIAGAVTFFLSVNDANNNGGRTGDAIYITNLTIEEANSTSTEDYVISQIDVFPNPTNGLLSIRSEATKIQTVEVFNSIGAVLLTKHQPTQIDISNFSPGIYYLLLATSQGRGVKKIILE